MGDFNQQTDDLFRAISEIYANVQVRGRNINEGVQRINQQIRAAFELLGDFDGRIARIVERIRNLRGLSQAEKDRILNKIWTYENVEIIYFIAKLIYSQYK